MMQPSLVIINELLSVSLVPTPWPRPSCRHGGEQPVQGAVDFPNERANGFHVMLDAEELVTMRCDQVECLK